MNGKHALVVSSHPRANSLTTAVAARARDTLVAEGYTVDLLDLYAEGFDPLLVPEDEPDWEDATKRYSDEVHAHMDRVAAADLIVVVFPVWWFGLPAMAKGWVDRVWNRGFAYEPTSLTGKRMLWVGLAAGSEADFAPSGFDKAIDTQLRVGVSKYCGIDDASVHLVHDTFGTPNLDAVDDLVLARRVAA